VEAKEEQHLKVQEGLRLKEEQLRGGDKIATGQ
jgi:hypothetical protein